MSAQVTKQIKEKSITQRNNKISILDKSNQSSKKNQ